MIRKVFGITSLITIIFVVIIGGYIVKSWAVEDISMTEQETEEIGEQSTAKSSNGVGLVAAALAIGLSSIGSGIAVAVVASSAVGAISEKPELLGKTVIFAGLAEGIAIYGLIIAIMILSKI